MGHKTYKGTSKYLHLTSELYPEILEKMEAAFGGLLPERMELMNKPTDFARSLADYFTNYMAGQRNLSVNTIRSYRDTFCLL